MKDSRRYTSILKVLVFFGILIFCSTSFAEEKTVPLDKGTDKNFLKGLTLSTGGIGYSFPFKSKIRGSSDRLAGDTIDFVDDLDLDSWFWIPDLELPFEFKEGHEITLYFSSQRYSGYTNIGKSFNFKEHTYQEGQDVKSKYSQDNIEAYYSYRFLEIGKFDYWVTAGVGYIYNKIKLDSAYFGKEVAQVSSAYPIIGGIVSYELNDRLSIECDVTNGIFYAKSNKILLFEGSLMMNYNIFKWLIFTGGYDLSLFEGKRFDNKMSFYDHGPFCVLDVKF